MPRKPKTLQSILAWIDEASTLEFSCDDIARCNVSHITQVRRCIRAIEEAGHITKSKTMNNCIVYKKTDTFSLEIDTPSNEPLIEELDAVNAWLESLKEPFTQKEYRKRVKDINLKSLISQGYVVREGHYYWPIDLYPSGGKYIKNTDMRTVNDIDPLLATMMGMMRTEIKI